MKAFNFRNSAVAHSPFPNELVLLILQYLPTEDLARCSQVCHSWRTVSHDPSLWAPHANRVRTVVSNGCSGSCVSCHATAQCRAIGFSAERIWRSFRSAGVLQQVENHILGIALALAVWVIFSIRYFQQSTSSVFAGLLLAVVSPTFSEKCIAVPQWLRTTLRFFIPSFALLSWFTSSNFTFSPFSFLLHPALPLEILILSLLSSPAVVSWWKGGGSQMIVALTRDTLAVTFFFIGEKMFHVPPPVIASNMQYLRLLVEAFFVFLGASFNSLFAVVLVLSERIVLMSLYFAFSISHSRGSISTVVFPLVLGVARFVVSVAVGYGEMNESGTFIAMKYLVPLNSLLVLSAVSQIPLRLFSSRFPAQLIILLSVTTSIFLLPFPFSYISLLLLVGWLLVANLRFERIADLTVSSCKRWNAAPGVSTTVTDDKTTRYDPSLAAGVILKEEVSASRRLTNSWFAGIARKSIRPIPMISFQLGDLLVCEGMLYHIRDGLTDKYRLNRNFVSHVRNGVVVANDVFSPLLELFDIPKNKLIIQALVPLECIPRTAPLVNTKGVFICGERHIAWLNSSNLQLIDIVDVAMFLLYQVAVGPDFLVSSSSLGAVMCFDCSPGLPIRFTVVLDSPPQIVDGARDRVIALTHNSLIGMDAETGEVIYQIDDLEYNSFYIVSNGDAILCQDADRMWFHCRRADTGELCWSWNIVCDVRHQLIVTDDWFLVRAKDTPDCEHPYQLPATVFLFGEE